MRLLILILSVLSLQMLWAQKSSLELKISNDKLVFQDRYYTSGLHVTYRNAALKLFKNQVTAEKKIQLNVTFGNETYTPTNIYSFDTVDFDRPYAGWLFGAVELVKFQSTSALVVALESGITGEESLSGTLQTEFHDLVNIDSNPTWFQEIAFNWLFNLKVSNIHEFNLGEKARFQNYLQGSLGSKDVFIANEMRIFFGKLNRLQDSYRVGALSGGNRNEFFGFVAAGYKSVFLNALIEGAPFSNRDAFTVVAQQHVFNAALGSVVRTKSCVFKLEYIFNTKETPASTSHAYGAFTFGVNF